MSWRTYSFLMGIIFVLLGGNLAFWSVLGLQGSRHTALLVLGGSGFVGVVHVVSGVLIVITSALVSSEVTCPHCQERSIGKVSVLGKLLLKSRPPERH